MSLKLTTLIKNHPHDDSEKSYGKLGWSQLVILVFTHTCTELLSSSF